MRNKNVPLLLKQYERHLRAQIGDTRTLLCSELVLRRWIDIENDATQYQIAKLTKSRIAQRPSEITKKRRKKPTSSASKFRDNRGKIKNEEK